MAAYSLASSLALALDPVRWAKSKSIDPDPWQADVLRCADKKILLNCSRQSGKSLIAAVIGTHTAIYRPGSLVLVLAPSLRQSGELYRMVRLLYDGVSDAESRTLLELENGSRVVCLPGTEKTVRSFSAVDLLLIDEASRVDDDLFVALRPMLAVSRGRVVALSTPFGRRGWWYEAWRGPENWKRVMVTAEQCPRITKEFLEEERRTIGDWWYEQEYECQFKDTDDVVFTVDEIDTLFSHDIVPFPV